MFLLQLHHILSYRGTTACDGFAKLNPFNRTCFINFALTKFLLRFPRTTIYALIRGVGVLIDDTCKYEACIKPNIAFE